VEPVNTAGRETGLFHLPGVIEIKRRKKFPENTMIFGSVQK